MTTASRTTPQRRRRTRRDTVVDVQVIVLSFVVGALIVGFVEETDGMSPGLTALNVLTLLLATVALWWRRRFPVAVAVPLLLMTTYLDGPSVAAYIALFTVAVHRGTRTVAWVAALAFVTGIGYGFLHPTPDVPWWVSSLLGIAVIGAIVGWSTAVRHRRELLRSWQERAERGEEEQAGRVEQARQLERTRIAREMHDVLAHRISLISMHAGALEYRPDASPTQVAAAAGVVRETAHQALEDLRVVLGVLRSGDLAVDGDGVEPPQPTLFELPALLAECREAGLRVELRNELAPDDVVPVQQSRTAYRVVQEGLTNARKHSPGAQVVLTLRGEPGRDLVVAVSNARAVSGGFPAGSAADVPGSGTGLVGLAERAALAGGSLRSGWQGDEFVLEATLPWPAQ